MENYQNWTPEAEKKEKRARRTALVIILVVVCMLLTMFAVICMTLWSVFRTMENGTPLPTITVENAAVPEITAVLERGSTEREASNMDSYLAEKLAYIENRDAMVENLGTGYDAVYPILRDGMNCIAKKDGKWGIISITGEELAPFKFNRYSFLDNTGTIELEKDGEFYVYDETGKLLRKYSDKLTFRQESEEAYLYRTAKAHMSDMIITTTIPEILEDDYYGVEYFSKKTMGVVYSAVGGYDEVGLFTFPDETGRAVAIQGNGRANSIYYITGKGCESREMELPDGVNGRWFDFLGDYTWADISLSNGWLKVYVCDAVPSFLIDDYKYYNAFLNVDTLELVPFPEEYQGYFHIYNMGYGDAVALSEYNEGTEYYKYAICKGSKKLTEELYYWVEFGETYITAGHDNGVDILNYDGKVLATYWDVSGSFINGKMLVADEIGAYFIDENLKLCSDYVVRGEIDGCFSRGVIIDDLYYLIEEFAQ